MPDSTAYDPVLSGEVVKFLAGLSRPQQRRLVTLLFQLAEEPFQMGDYSTTDATGRQLENIVLSEWRVTYWSDHSARELRVMDVAEI